MKTRRLKFAALFIAVGTLGITGCYHHHHHYPPPPPRHHGHPPPPPPNQDHHDNGYHPGPGR